MDWSKYDKIPEEFATAKEIGLAAATLGAMARRGFVEVLDTSPKQYRKINNPAIKIYKLCEENKDDYDTHFTLRKSTEKLGMYCSIKNDTIVDAWDNPYDLANVNRIEFRTRNFDI